MLQFHITLALALIIHQTTLSKENPKCDMVPEAGMCMAYIERYFYNTTTKTCQTFIYGGCAGNQNNFVTLEDCTTECLTEEPEKLISPENDACHEAPKMGNCRASMIRYYYNATIGECDTFIYGGCNGNANNFMTMADCENRCKGNYGSRSETEEKVA